MYSIGIDIGGMSAKIGVVESNEVKVFRTIPTNSDIEYGSFLQEVFDTIEELTASNGKQTLDKIGISSCGLIDTDKGKITYSNNIKWEDRNIVIDIKNKFAVPVRIANDAKCAVLAEAVIGAGKDYDRVCMITIGTGVGGGFITGKKLELGSLYRDASGILGHISVVAGGRQCTCGRKGCLEAYASSTAIMASYKEKTGNMITTKEIFERIRFEAAAREVYEEFLYYLGEGLISICNVLRPEVIVIGGGVSNSADLYTGYLEKYVNHGVYGGKAIPVVITAAELGNEAGIIGATLL